jgi:hypothetical protein
MNIFDDYTLQVELYGLAQDYSVLEILYLVSEPLLLAKTWKCIYWQKGKCHKLTVKNTKQLIHKLSQLQYNEIEIKSSQVVFLPNTNQSILFNFDGYLNISPTNEMWDSVWDDYFEDHAHEQRRMSYQSKEGSTRYSNVQQRPLFYEFSIPGIKSDNPDEILVKLIPTIVETIERNPIATSYFGGLEFHKNGFTNPFVNSLDSLAPWPGTYSLIGEYVDKLRPLTIASESLCRKIVQTLSLPEKSIIPLVPCKTTTTTTMAIVHIPYDIINDDRQKNVISSLLVPKNDSTATPRYGSAKGEFTLDGSLMCTLRRFKELTDQKIMPRLRGPCEYTVYLSIPEKYCVMLGIDPEDMIVSQVQKERKKLNEERFDLFFNQTPESWSIRERVRKVIEMLPITGSEYADFLIQHYLS